MHGVDFIKAHSRFKQWILLKKILSDLRTRTRSYEKTMYQAAQATLERTNSFGGTNEKNKFHQKVYREELEDKD